MTEYMDMSDPSVQRMLDDDRAEALAQWRSVQQEEEDNYQKVRAAKEEYETGADCPTCDGSGLVGPAGHWTPCDAGGDNDYGEWCCDDGIVTNEDNNKGE